MSKDHKPGGFNRTCDYRSDLEIAETGDMVKSVNTSFGSKNHNSYIMRTDATHEHFYYNPQSQKSGWHGNNFETRNNHPNLQSKQDGGKDMNVEKRNSFLESLKVDQATIDRCNAVSRNASQKANTPRAKSNSDGGREIGDDGSGSLGRESGAYKGESSSGQNSTNSGHSSAAGQGPSGNVGQSTGGQSPGGQSTGGQGSGGQSSGGHSGGQGGH